jgi:hypothetical protein
MAPTAAHRPATAGEEDGEGKENPRLLIPC